MSEVIQNLEVDRSNWGCARTGFIYNQSKRELSYRKKYFKIHRDFWASH